MNILIQPPMIFQKFQYPINKMGFTLWKRSVRERVAQIKTVVGLGVITFRPWGHHGFLTFSEGIEMEHWVKMG